MNKKKDYYRILGVSTDATEDEIKRAFWELAKKWHPDRVPPDMKAEAGERFKEINEAYHVLIDRRRRVQYDRTGFIPEEMFEEVRRSMEEVFASFEELRIQFEGIMDMFEEMEMILRVTTRFIAVFFGLLICIFVLEASGQKSWPYTSILVIGPIIFYALTTIADMIAFKGDSLLPGGEFKFLIGLIKKKLRQRRAKEITIRKRRDFRWD